MLLGSISNANLNQSSIGLVSRNRQEIRVRSSTFTCQFDQQISVSCRKTTKFFMRVCFFIILMNFFKTQNACCLNPTSSEASFRIRVGIQTLKQVFTTIPGTSITLDIISRAKICIWMLSSSKKLQRSLKNLPRSLLNWVFLENCS